MRIVRSVSPTGGRAKITCQSKRVEEMNVSFKRGVRVYLCVCVCVCVGVGVGVGVWVWVCVCGCGCVCVRV